jgi:hypothetical protein
LEKKNAEIKNMYSDFKAELKVKDAIIESQKKTVSDLRTQIKRLLKMIHYPRLVEMLKAKSKTMSIADTDDFNFDLTESPETARPQNVMNQSMGSLGAT